MADANKKQNEEIPYRLYLREDQIPTQWYNLRADMPEPPEPMRLPNGKIAEHDDIAPVFCDKLVDQELDDETAYFDIPEGVQEMYKVYRPSPLCRAYNLERYLNTPAKIYYKFEGNNTSGSHKLNSALAQAYYAQEQGLDKITTETGAGQWGTALSEAADHYGVDLDVFMVKCSYEQKPFRRYDHADLQRDRHAVAFRHDRDRQEDARRASRTPPARLARPFPRRSSAPLNVPENKGRYQLGSVLNQVVLHQSIIGLESYDGHGGTRRVPRHRHRLRRRRLQPRRPHRTVHARQAARRQARYALHRRRARQLPVASRAASTPTTSADTGQTCPLVKMYTLGSGFHARPPTMPAACATTA